MKAGIIFCEGPHDVAFLHQILSSLSFREYVKEVSKLPFPLPEHFKSKFRSLNYEDIRVDNSFSIFPTVLLKNNCIALLYPMGGDNTRIDRIKAIIDDYMALLNIDEVDFSGGREKIEELAYIFLLDADDKGIERRLCELKDNFKDSFPTIDDLNHDDIVNCEGYDLGCFIIGEHHGDEYKGNLENFLLPIMRKDNEAVFAAAEVFVTAHLEERRNKLFKKAVIGTAGQVVKAGMTNTVIIKQSGYITSDKIIQDANCQRISSFLNRVFG